MTAIPGFLASAGVAGAGGAVLLSPRRASAAFGVRGTFVYSGGRAQEQRRAAAVEEKKEQDDKVISGAEKVASASAAQIRGILEDACERAHMRATAMSAFAERADTKR